MHADGNCASRTLVPIIRFICAEPLLEPVRLDLRGIHWCIVGGESGPGARHMPAERARHVRDQCRAAGVPPFVKQMSRRQAIPDDLLIREFPQLIETGGFDGRLLESQNNTSDRA